MFAYAVENRLKRWFTGDAHTKNTAGHFKKVGRSYCRNNGGAKYAPLFL